jgi:hypothetical protein
MKVSHNHNVLRSTGPSSSLVPDCLHTFCLVTEYGTIEPTLVPCEATAMTIKAHKVYRTLRRSIELWFKAQGFRLDWTHDITNPKSQ